MWAGGALLAWLGAIATVNEISGMPHGFSLIMMVVILIVGWVVIAAFPRRWSANALFAPAGWRSAIVTPGETETIAMPLDQLVCCSALILLLWEQLPNGTWSKSYARRVRNTGSPLALSQGSLTGS